MKQNPTPVDHYRASSEIVDLKLVRCQRELGSEVRNLQENLQILHNNMNVLMLHYARLAALAAHEMTDE